MGQNVLVDFYAPWCKACVKFGPKYIEAADEAARNGLDVVFAKVNTDQNPYLTQTFGVNTFPRLLLFPRNGATPKRQETQWLKITEKVAFNIASEASYVQSF